VASRRVVYAVTTQYRPAEPWTTTTMCRPRRMSLYHRENRRAVADRALRRTASGSARTSAILWRYAGRRSGGRSAMWRSRSVVSSISLRNHGHENRLAADAVM